MIGAEVSEEKEYKEYLDPRLSPPVVVKKKRRFGRFLLWTGLGVGGAVVLYNIFKPRGRRR